jgi:subtilase family serine protease
MRHRRVGSTLTSLAIGALGALAFTPIAAAEGTATVQSRSAAVSRSTPVGTTPASSQVNFDVGLELSDPSGATAFAKAVSDPKSATYRHFITTAQWARRFSPTQASVNSVTSWLRAQGIAVETVTPDRLTVEASGTAAAVEKAFGTGLGQYRRHGKTVRLATASLKAPASIAGLISGVSGIDENLATPDIAGARDKARGDASPAKKTEEELPQPGGFRNATPCSTYYGEKLDTTDPAFGNSYPEPFPYSPCGYTPPQLQSAYGLDSQIAAGHDGTGVTVAIVDAYRSPSLLADATEYAAKNQPTQPFEAGHFSELNSPTFNKQEICEANEWFGEQTLDIEAVHATAPGANILYVGAKNCFNGLYNSVQQVVDGHLANIITDSWGDDGGDILDSPGSRRGFDNILLLAISEGIGVQFSSGDEGDEFALLGITTPDYPSSSPFETSVGGTSLQVNAAGERAGELGWSTAKAILCTQEFAEIGGCGRGKIGKWLPKRAAFLYGSGGGTSFEYPEPFYQEGVVPQELAERNSALTGILNRVEPDVSMLADPTTGMLVGETQTFPDGVYYDQYRIGGTSLASPLFAGEMADADQAAGGALGFINPLLYEVDASEAASSAFYDVLPGGLQADVREDFADEVDAEEGLITSIRLLNYEGKEKFCSGTGNCTRQKVALSTAPGFDSMTGIGSPAEGLIPALAAAGSGTAAKK